MGRTPKPPSRPPQKAARRSFAQLPTFTLYGETAATAPLLHAESISSRSRLYGWEIGAHVHHGLHQVLWVRSGTVDAHLDETRTSAQGPVALAIPPGVAHAFRFSPGCDGHVLTLNAGALAEGDPADAGEALQALFAQPRVMPLEADSPDVARLQPLFDALLAECQSADSTEGPVPIWLARAVVWRLARLSHFSTAQAARQRAAGRQSLYTRWVVLVEANYRAQWPVSRYADTLGLSTERLNRMVRAETGHTAQALLHARLTREACRRLVHVAAPVSMLAFELGFEDPAYFCRFFKRHTGLSPRAYRDHALAAAAHG